MCNKIAISPKDTFAIHLQHALIHSAPTRVSATQVIKILVLVILELIVKTLTNVFMEHQSTNVPLVLVVMNYAKTLLVAIVVVACKDILKMITISTASILMNASKERILVMLNLRSRF